MKICSTLMVSTSMASAMSQCVTRTTIGWRYTRCFISAVYALRAGLDAREAGTPWSAKPRAMRFPSVLIMVLVVVACVQMAYSYPLIVANPMASHFNVAGVPNGWQTKEVFFTSCGVMLALLTVIFHGFPALLYRLPASSINMPYKEYWLAPERRERTLGELAARFQWLGFLAIVFFDVVIRAVLVADMMADPRLPTDRVLIPLVIYFVLVLAQIAGLLMMFRRPPLEA